jgi:transposase
MDVLVERCAGLDVHRDNVVATVRVPGSGRRRWEQQSRTFSATLAGLAALADWLSEFGVTLVGMEATGVYWKTVFQALEDRFECWLLNAHHLRNVPGRKTDVKDSEWICQLVQHGLVRPSFVPPPEIRRLRDLTRLRKAQINERARSIQRLEKVLQDAGIKLSSVASSTYSKSARAMLEALLAGITDPEQLAELSKARMRRKIPQLREALASRFQIEHHGVMVAQLLAHIDTLDAAIQNLSERIASVLTPHQQVVELLCTIPGVQTHAAEVLIAECGLDMTLFPTVGHFASWAGPRAASRSGRALPVDSAGNGPFPAGSGERSWLPERAATEVAGLSCGASGQAVTSRRVIRQAPIRSGSTIQMASEVPACAHWVALMTSSVIWPRARALSTHGATPENTGSETTAIHDIGSAKRRTMAGVEASRIAPNATPTTIPVVR